MATVRKLKAETPVTPLDPDGPMAGYMLVREWVRLYGAPLFTSYDSLDWFIRQHPTALKDCPHFLRAKGRRYLRPEFAEWLKAFYDREGQAALEAREAINARHESERAAARGEKTHGTNVPSKKGGKPPRKGKGAA